MYKPLENNLIIRKIEPQKVTASGIILTSQDSEEVNTAEVIAIGSSITDIEIGCTVMFCPYSGYDIGEGLTQINYYDVLGIIS